MQGKTVLITGGNSGIGLETAVELCKRGAFVVIVARSDSKGRQAIEEIAGRTGSRETDYIVGDLSSLASVRAIAQTYKQRYKRLDVLINNAGTMKGSIREISVDGFEATFATNYIGMFLLTHLLLDLLKLSVPSRIVNVSSMVYKYGRIDFEDLPMERQYSAMKAYSRSKLAVSLFSLKLAETVAESGITVNFVHPGYVGTGIGGDAKSLMSILMKLAKPFALSPAKGAQTSIHVASSPELAASTGGYYIRKKRVPIHPAALDRTLQQKLWDVTLRLVKLNT